MWRAGKASPRPVFLGLVSFLSGILLLINIQQTYRTFHFNNLSLEKPSEQHSSDAQKEHENKQHNNKSLKLLYSSVKVYSDEITEFPSHKSNIPWYMANGGSWPSRSKSGEKRTAALFPDEAPGEDRITSKNA